MDSKYEWIESKWIEKDILHKDKNIRTGVTMLMSDKTDSKEHMLLVIEKSVLNDRGVNSSERYKIHKARAGRTEETQKTQQY